MLGPIRSTGGLGGHTPCLQGGRYSAVAFFFQRLSAGRPWGTPKKQAEAPHVCPQFCPPISPDACFLWRKRNGGHMPSSRCDATLRFGVWRAGRSRTGGATGDSHGLLRHSQAATSARGGGEHLQAQCKLGIYKTNTAVRFNGRQSGYYALTNFVTDSVKGICGGNAKLDRCILLLIQPANSN